MFSKRTFLTSLLVFILVSMLKVSHTQAISNTTLEFSGASNPDNVCTHGFVDAYAAFTANTDDGGGSDAIGFTLVDGYGVPLWAEIDLFPTSSDPLSQFPRFALGTVNGAIHDITARPVTIRMYDTSITNADTLTKQQIFDALTNSGTLLGTVKGDPAFIEGFCDTLPVPGYHFSPLIARFVCTPAPGFATWRVRSYNLYGETFTYNLPQLNYSLVQFMPGTLNDPGHPPYEERDFTTGAAPHLPTLFRLYVNNHLQSIAISRSKTC